MNSQITQLQFSQTAMPPLTQHKFSIKLSSISTRFEVEGEGYSCVWAFHFTKSFFLDGSTLMHQTVVTDVEKYVAEDCQ